MVGQVARQFFQTSPLKRGVVHHYIANRSNILDQLLYQGLAGIT